MTEPVDPRRFCAYCGADREEAESEHAADCPSNTGIYPVTEKDLLCCCGRPLPEDQRMVCPDCGVRFEVGDSYTHRWDDDTPLGTPPVPAEVCADAPTGAVICLGCAAIGALVA